MKSHSLLHRYKTVILLSLVLLTAFALRSYGRNWDEGGHLHPDERMLIMVADRIHFPDNLNPDFFNYGTLPIYLLRGSAQLLDVTTRPSQPFASYNGMLMLGRTLSSIFDVGTVALIFYSLYQLTRSRISSLFASLLYALAFFPIQNSHFFVVDVFLTFFITALVASLIRFAQKRSFSALLVMGLCMGAAVATKFTALVFMPGIIISLGIIHHGTGRIKQSRELARGASRQTQSLRELLALITQIIQFCVISFVIFYICMPFAILPPSGILSPPTSVTSSFPRRELGLFDKYPGINDVLNFLNPTRSPETRFLRDVRDQTRMNSDAYVFPYTLQYVTTKPYIYHIEQVFRWGTGPFIGLLTIIGALFLIRQLINVLTKRGAVDHVVIYLSNHDSVSRRKVSTLVLIVCLFVMFSLYFLIIGRSAVKFMRYMLPLYPLLAMLAGFGLANLVHRAFIKSHTISVMMMYKAFTAVLLIGTILWSLTFINVYSAQHTRIAATDWMLSHIPPGKTLAVEHWDDRVPIRYGEQYQYQEMTIYELPDDSKKWEMLLQKLSQSDYVILASNRLYTPLPKLADCSKFKVCYPLATKYYEELFDGSLGFEKVKEFTAYPQLGPWTIVDDSADESFTVYEHPKVMIFKNERTQ
ncbi:glycosyltransferase family 39 protein [Candidatus Woesebacteria bacterium]|nr:glycosyltransferase family 39 protein [Candidatus Woesebacteria bacterium]